MQSALCTKHFGLLVINILMVFLIYIYQNSINRPENENNLEAKAILQRTKYLVDTPACKIPNLDPFDLEVRKFYSYRGDIKCPHADDAFASANRTHLIIKMDRLIRMHGNNIACGYTGIRRKRSQETYIIDSNYRNATSFTPIADEFIMVECKSKKVVVYCDLFPFINVKPEVEKKCDLNLNRWLNETGETIVERLSVSILGIDSVSRLNMLRHMPKAFAYLRDVMNAIELQGFTKVADNIFPNIVPMLSGRFVNEFRKSLNEKYLDFMNLVWKDFADKGYRTLFAEDQPELAIFNLHRRGFYHPPTDYYLRPFTLAAAAKLDLKRHCYNHRVEADVLLQWLTDFLITFQEKKTFSFMFNTRLTHGALNDAGSTDMPYYNFLKRFHQSNLTNNSILIFFSDHGIRYGKIRETYIGKIEERMPFHFLVFPPWFRSKYPKIWKNLQTNRNRLTTSFDVYATLKDILNFTGNAKKASVSDRGISLFSEIPRERTCKHAAILPHWCTCDQRTKVDTADIRVQKAARKLMKVINAKIAGESLCATLELDEILDSYVTDLGESVLTYENISNNGDIQHGKRATAVFSYLVTIRVNPSSALFEGTIQYDESSDIYFGDGEISRITLYGNQAHCMHNVELQKFCYCIPPLDR